MTQPVEKGKLFGLPLWLALVVFTVAALVGAFVIVAMRELLGWNLPGFVGGGLGGLFGFIAVQVVARWRGQKKTDGA